MHGFGFIGFGNMAKVIIGGLVNYAGIDPRSVYVTRGDKSRLGEVADAFKGVNTVETCADVTENAKIIFLCVKPAEMKNVIAEISAAANEETHIVSLSVVISMEDLEKLFNGKVTKYVPSVTSETGAGVSLMNHSNRVAAEEAAYIENIIGRFSTVKHIRDEDWGFASELTSCMPGFIASVFGHFADSALRHTESFNEEEIRWLITETLYASAKLLRTTGAEYKQVVSKVATKGGITQEGVDVFNEALPAVFDELFKRTTAKMRAAEEKLKLGWS